MVKWEYILGKTPTIAKHAQWACLAIVGLFPKMYSPEIFDEIKKNCKENKSDLTSVIDVVHGAKNISNPSEVIPEVSES